MKNTLLRFLLLPFTLMFSSAALKVYFIAVVAAFFWVAHKKVMAYLCTVEEFMVSPTELNFGNLPSWVDDGIRKEIETSFPYREKFSIFTSAIEERLKRSYASNPWVLDVRNFRRQFPHKIHFSLLLRCPVVSVERNGVFYIVSADGVLLPRTYDAPPTIRRRLYLLTGVTSSPPEFGQRWDDDAVRNGISVALALEEHSVHKLVEIGSIDVSNIGGRINPCKSEIVLLTGAGVPIHWGRAPITKMYGEVSVEQKIKNLRTVLRFSPDLYGLEYAKIQFDRPYVKLRR